MVQLVHFATLDDEYYYVHRDNSDNEVRGTRDHRLIAVGSVLPWRYSEPQHWQALAILVYHGFVTLMPGALRVDFPMTYALAVSMNLPKFWEEALPWGM